MSEPDAPSKVLSYADAASRYQVQIDENEERVRIFCPARTWRNHPAVFIAALCIMGGQLFMGGSRFAAYFGFDHRHLPHQISDILYGMFGIAAAVFWILLAVAASRRWIAIEMTDTYLMETCGRFWRGVKRRRWLLTDIGRISADRYTTGIYIQLRRGETGIYLQLGAGVNRSIADVLQRRLEQLRNSSLHDIAQITSSR